MDIKNDFINAYKKIEGLLAERNKGVLDYERTLPPLDRKKLQLCRLVRNFLQHETEIFCPPTVEMTSFLVMIGDKLTGKSQKSGRTANEIITKLRPISVNSSIEDACSHVKPGVGITPVTGVEEEYLGCLTTAMMRKFIVMDNDGKTLKNIQLATDIPIITPDIKVDEIEQGISIVTENGNLHGRYMGIVEKTDEWQ